LTFDRILAGILAMGVLVAVYVSVDRHRALAAGQTVELTLSLPAARESSATQAFPFEEIIERFRSAGVTSLLVRGMTLQTLLDYGGTGFPTTYPVWLAVESEQERDRRVYIRGNPELAQWIEQRLVGRLGADRVQRDSRSTPDMLDLRIANVELSDLLALNLGVHPVDLALATRLGLSVVVELAENLPDLTLPVDLSLLLEGVPAGAPILFSGRTSLGEAELALNYLTLGQHSPLIDHSAPPFSSGLSPGVGRLNLPAVKMLRVTFSHTPNDIVVAVRDRQMRLILLQPFHLSGNLDLDLLQQVANWEQVSHDLERIGFTTGRAESTRPYSPRPWLKILVGLGVGAAAALFLSPFPGWTRGSILVAMGAIAAVPLTLAWQGLALVAAILLPVLGAAASYRQKRFTLRMGFLIGAALAAGVMITALLADARFALELEVFRGVKVALIAPFVLWIVWIVWRERKDLLSDFRLQVWHLGAMVVVLAVLWVMTVRSGHAVEWRLISGLELQVRQVLEHTFVIRPRFKEFLLGWPFLVLAYAAFQQDRTRLSYTLTAFGLIGVASMINSFAHLHTPFWISLIRGLHGVWIGILIGYIAVYALGRFQPILKRWKGAIQCSVNGCRSD